MSAPCKIAVYTLAKNEAKHCVRWAQTTADADYRVVLDTGSDDDTVEQLESLGVTVRRSSWVGPGVDEPEPVYAEGVYGVTAVSMPFRFDTARNLALSFVPADVDLCISLDMDETLDDNFIPALRELWDQHGPFHKANPWFFTGTWWRCDRVHSRHGWAWVAPCHEVTVWQRDTGLVVVDFEGTMRHEPDNDKPRDYTALLELAVKEQPDDARMWAYLIRERHFRGDTEGVRRDAFEHWETIAKGWPAEVAATARLASLACLAEDEPGAALTWLEAGVELGPLEAEAWGALAKFHYDRQEWGRCYAAALRGTSCPVAQTHYITDHALRAWGLWDYAAIAAHGLGDYDSAVECGYRAWKANPDDGRLLENLRNYVRLQNIPTYAVIPQKPGERGLETALLYEQLVAQGIAVGVEDSDKGIHWKWNHGIIDARRMAREEFAVRWNVLVINNDVTVDLDFVTIMAAALRAGETTGLAHPDDGTGTFTGWAFMLRGEDDLRIDEQFEWWYGDSDLVAQVAACGLTVEACPAKAEHHHPNESTFYDQERLAMARRDEARYAEKWGIDPATLFLARNPGWGARANGGFFDTSVAYLVGEAMAEITEDNLEEALLAVASKPVMITVRYDDVEWALQGWEGQDHLWGIEEIEAFTRLRSVVRR